MTIEYTARIAGVDDSIVPVAAVAEWADGTGRSLMFQAGEEPPDEQDVRLGIDSYCVVTEDQGTAYGCVRELTIDGDRLHVVLRDEALADLGLGDSVLQIRLEVPPESVTALRDYLGRILTYGRPEARPSLLRL